MNIYKKTALITCITLLCMVVVLYVASDAILLSGFTKAEQQDTRRNVERVNMALMDDISALEKVAGDWAAWDETYDFIQDGNLSYVERNAPTSSFVDLNLNLMMFVNLSGGIVYARGFNTKTHEDTEIPSSLRAFSADSVLLQHPNKYAGVTGMILAPEGAMIIISRPVLNNDRTKPVMGPVSHHSRTAASARSGLRSDLTSRKESVMRKKWQSSWKN